jgi:hypothetical protein
MNVNVKKLRIVLNGAKWRERRVEPAIRTALSECADSVRRAQSPQINANALSCTITHAIRRRRD